MSLVALTHRRLATVNASAATIPALLDAIWAAVDPAVTTYSDGSARTFSGSTATGWTWNRVQNAGVTEALWCSPPGGTMAQRVILAGRGVAPTPSLTMVAPDQFFTQGLFISHQLSAGAFTTYNSATPFTNARFMGYTRALNAATGFTTLAACVYETQETIYVEVLTNGTQVHFCMAGALFDPESSVATVGETDGRRYGVVVSGGNLVANFLGSGVANTLWASGTSNGNAHTYVWRPGVTTVDIGARQWVMTGAQTAAQMTDLAGQFPGVPLYMTASTGWAGRCREVSLGRPVLYHQRIVSGGATTAYGLGSSVSSATGDSLFLRY